MGRLGVTSEEVAQVAFDLEQAGKNPTVDNVREALQTGSKTTICKHLKTYRESGSRPPPQNISEEMIDAVHGIFAKLKREARTELDEFKLELKSERESYEAVVNKTSLTIADQRKQISQLQESLKDYQSQLSVSQALQEQYKQEAEKHQDAASKALARLASNADAIKDRQTLQSSFTTVEQELRGKILSLENTLSETELSLHDVKSGNKEKLTKLNEHHAKAVKKLVERLDAKDDRIKALQKEMSILDRDKQAAMYRENEALNKVAKFMLRDTNKKRATGVNGKKKQSKKRTTRARA